LRGRLTVSPYCGGDATGVGCDFFGGASRVDQTYQIKVLEGPPNEDLNDGDFAPEQHFQIMRAVYDTGTVTSDPRLGSNAQTDAPPNAKKLLRIEADFNLWDKKYTVTWIIGGAPASARPAEKK
jgi:hypothetical protein